MNTTQHKAINYSWELEYAAEYLDEHLGREATEQEIQEFLEAQEARIMEAFEYSGDE